MRVQLIAHALMVAQEERAMNEASGVARLPEVEQVSGLSRSSIYRLESTGDFPKRVKLGQRAVGWPREAVHKWCANRPTATANQAA